MDVRRIADGRIWMLLLGALFFFRYSAVELDRPWVFEHDFNGALFSNFARNHLERGWSVTAGADLWNPGSAEPWVPRYYRHHPPLISWVLAAAFSLFGVSEQVARLSMLVPLTFALLIFAYRILPRRPAVLPLVYWGYACALPALTYYGRMPGHEPLTLILVLLALAAAGGEGALRKRGLCGVCLCGGLLVWASWVGWLYAAALALFLLLRHGWRPALCFAYAAAFSLVLLLIWMSGPGGWDFSALLLQFARRSHETVADSGQAFTFFDWTLRLAQNLRELCGTFFVVPLLILPVFLRGQDRIHLLLTLAAPLATLLLLRQWVYVHEYWACYAGLACLVHVTYFLRRQGPLPAAVWVAALCLLHFTDARRQFRQRIQPRQASRHEVRLGRLTADALAPGERFLAVSMPGPVFLYYANRDVVLVGDPFPEPPPELFVQVHGSVPPGEDLQRLLRDYEPAGRLRRRITRP